MVAQRVTSSKYLGVSFAIAIGVAFNLGLSLQAQAQDFNLQTQLNILSPPPLQATTPVAPNVSAEKLTTFAKQTGLCPPGDSDLGLVIRSTDGIPMPEIQDILKSISTAAKKSAPKRAQMYKDLSAQPENLSAYLLNHPETVADLKRELQKRNKLAFNPVNLNCNIKQPTIIKVSFPFNPTYETDVLKTGNNSSHGESFGVGSNVLVTTAGLEGRPFDLVAMSAAETSSRYTPFFSQNVDIINTYLGYQAFLHADGYRIDTNNLPTTFEKNINKDTRDVPQSGMTTIETVAFGFQNQTAYTPTFHSEKADFFTPQITLTGQNFDLDDSKTAACVNSGNPAFCHYANLSLTIGQSISDVTTQQNTNVAASATIGWRPNQADWNLTLQTIATGKDYEDFVGGRRDLLLQIGPVFTYAPPAIKISLAEMASLSFSLPVTYYKNYSTFSPAAWSGLVIMPTLTIAFSYTKS
jgi:hypothetical protein